MARIGAIEIGAKGSHDVSANLSRVDWSVGTDQSKQEGDQEEEEDVCRICRTPGDKEAPLYFPCACSGSIKYVHQDCLLQWINHSNARQCEVCKHSFAFSPVYAEDAPARLPFKELLMGMVIKAGQGMNFVLRLAFVLLVWLVFIPFTTFWIWRLTFVRSVLEAQKLFISRFSPTLLLTDCLHGFLLSAGIVFIFLGATSLREYFRHLRELRGQDMVREDDGIDRQIGIRVGRRQGQGAAPLAQRVEQGNGVERVQPQADGRNGEGAVVEQGLAAGAGQLIRRNAENVAARLENQAARLEAHADQIFDGADDADGAEDVPFDELVGMQGPVFHLVENAVTVLASNAIFLGLVAFLPFTLGRIVLSLASHLVVTGSASAKLASTLSSSAAASVHWNNTMIKGNISAGAFPGVTFPIERPVTGNDSIGEILFNDMNGFSSIASVKVVASPMDALTEAMVASLRLSDAATIAVGYSVILMALTFYIGLIALIRYNRGEPLTVGRIHGVASMAEAAPSIARQVISALKYLMTMAKVAFLLLIELGVFPLMCGWWLDICTLSMLGATIANRVAFFWASPLTSSLLHWLVGIVYMLQISIFVSLLREVLRPGVLYFLRDPADPNYNPFRDLIDDPIHKHARRVLLSVVVYGSLIVLLIFLPVQAAMSVAPKMFPLDIRVSDPFTEIPVDMLLFHICIPFAIEHFRPRATIKVVLFHWFSMVGWALGLTKFLLPGPEDRNEQGRGPAGVQERQQGRAQDQNQVRLLPPAPAVEGEPQVAGNASTASTTVEEVDFDEQTDSDEYEFVVRIVLLLFGAWVTLLSFNSAMILLPVSLGRAMFSSLSHLPITYSVKCNDLYAFNIGCYVIWATAAAIGYAVDYLNTHNLKVLVMQFLKWAAIVTKSFVLLFLWIVVIPVLIGLLFELLVVVPLRVPIDESPVFLLYQDWALGLVFLKIWTRLVMLGQITPLADESWRAKFEQVKVDGFSRLRGLWVFQEIVSPILVKLLTALCAPYVFARGIFPILGYSLIVNSAVYRFAWSGCLMLGVFCYGVKLLHHWFLDLHNSIRDERYLIGKRLHNYREEKVTASMQAVQSSDEKFANGQGTLEDTMGNPELPFPTNSLASQEGDVLCHDVDGVARDKHENGFGNSLSDLVPEEISSYND
eukprot:c28905_g1_i2 orf=77-3538(+)